MPDDDAEIQKIKDKIRKNFEERAEVADKFLSEKADDKESLRDVKTYLEQFYGIKIEVEEQNPDDPARPVNFNN